MNSVLLGVIAATGPVSLAPPSVIPTPLGHWPLDIITSGTTPDIESPGNDMTSSGAPSIVAGRFDNAIYFDGITDSMLSAPFSPASEFSVSLWFNTSELPLGIYGTILSGVESAVDGSIFEVGVLKSGGELYFYDGTFDFGSLPNYIDGLWHHVVVTVNAASSVQFWVDGILESTRLYSGVTPSPVERILLAAEPDSGLHSDYYSGSIDQVRFYNYKITDEAIAALYAETPSP